MLPTPRTALTASLLTASLLAASLLTTAPIAAQDPAPTVPTSRRPVAGSEGLELHVRDLEGLTDRLVDMRSGEDFGFGSDAARRKARAEMAEMLREATQAFLQPALDDGQDVRLLAGRHLVTVATAEQQAWIDRLLTHQPTVAEYIVRLDVRLFRVDAATIAELELGDEPHALDGAAGGRLAGQLSDRLKKGAVELLQGPQLSVWPLMSAHLTVVRQVSYVRDFEVEVAADGSRMADPIVDVVQDGAVYTVGVVPLADGRVGLLGEMQLTDLLEPIPTKDIELSPGAAKVTIQVPAVREFAVDTALSVPAGGLGVFPGPTFDGKRLLLVVRAHTQA